MADMIRIDLTGERELQKAFKQLEKKAKLSVGRKGIRAGAKPLVKRTRQLIGAVSPGKHGSGNLKKSIGIKIKRFGGVDVLIAGPRVDGKHKGQHAFIVEYGTKERFTKSGASRGVMPAHPFMRPAFAQTKGISVRKGEAAIKKAVNMETVKAAR